LVLEIGSCASEAKCDELENHQDREGKIKLPGQPVPRERLCLGENGEKHLAMLGGSSYKVTKIKHADRLALK